MKLGMMILFVLSTAAFAEARTTYVNGRGMANGYCSGSMGSMCISNIKSAAERDGGRDAQWNCQMARGNSLSYTLRCNTSCFPSFISPGDQNRPVRCNSSCSMQCEVPN